MLTRPATLTVSMRVRLWRALKRASTVGVLLLFAWNIACASGPELADQEARKKLPSYQAFQCRLREALNGLTPQSEEVSNFMGLLSQGVVPPVAEALEAHFQLVTDLWQLFENEAIDWYSLKSFFDENYQAIFELRDGCQSYFNSANPLKFALSCLPFESAEGLSAVVDWTEGTFSYGIPGHYHYYWNDGSLLARITVADWPFIHMRNMALGLIVKLSKMRMVHHGLRVNPNVTQDALMLELKKVIDEVRQAYDQYQLAQIQCLEFLSSGGMYNLLAFELGPFEESLLIATMDFCREFDQICKSERFKAITLVFKHLEGTIYTLVGRFYQNLKVYSSQLVELALPERCIFEVRMLVKDEGLNRDASDGGSPARNATEIGTIGVPTLDSVERQAWDADGAGPDGSASPFKLEDDQGRFAASEAALAQLREQLAEHYTTIEDLSKKHLELLLKESCASQQQEERLGHAMLKLTHLLHGCQVLESHIRLICPGEDDRCKDDILPPWDSVNALLSQVHTKALEYVERYKKQNEMAMPERVGLVRASFSLPKFIQVARQWLETHSVDPNLDGLHEEFPDVDYDESLSFRVGTVKRATGTR